MLNFIKNIEPTLEEQYFFTHEDAEDRVTFKNFYLLKLKALTSMKVDTCGTNK